MMQRRQQNLPSRQHRAWETGSAAGVLAWLVTWNLLVFGFDTSFAITMVSSIVVGIAVALLVRHRLTHSKQWRADT